METNQWLKELKACFKRNINKDFREIKWEAAEEEDLQDKFHKLYTKLNDHDILIRECDPGQWDMEVLFEGESVWSYYNIFELNVAQFLGIIRADPTYWNKEIVSDILIQSLHSLDYDFTDLITVEEAGWEDLLKEDRCKEDEDSGLMIKVVLIDGTTAVMGDDGWWAIK